MAGGSPWLGQSVLCGTNPDTTPRGCRVGSWSPDAGDRGLGRSASCAVGLHSLGRTRGRVRTAFVLTVALPGAPWTPGEAQPGPATSQPSQNLPPKTQQSQHSQKPTTKQGEGKFSLDKLTRMLQLENLGGFLKISS